MTESLSPVALAALKQALSSRGKSKGLLLKTCPSPFSCPLGYAAWQAAMMSINVHKVSIGGIILMTKPEERAVYDEILAYFDAHPELRFADRDRAALERLGVW